MVTVRVHARVMNLKGLLHEAKLQGGGQMGCSGTLMEALVQVAVEARRVRKSEIGLLHLTELDGLFTALDELRAALTKESGPG